MYVVVLLLCLTSGVISGAFARDLDVDWINVYSMTFPIYDDTVVVIEGCVDGYDYVEYVEIEYKVTLLGSWYVESTSRVADDVFRGTIQPTYFEAGKTVYYRMVAYGGGLNELSKESWEMSFDVAVSSGFDDGNDGDDDDDGNNGDDGDYTEGADPVFFADDGSVIYSIKLYGLIGVVAVAGLLIFYSIRRQRK